MDPDQSLIQRARRGDLDAFEQLVERHRDVVHRVAARLVGPDEAQDVSQDAFLRAFHRLAKFRGEAPFRAWLLQITHNAGLNALARKRPDPRDPHEAAALAATSADAPRQPAEQVESGERRERLELKLASLRPTYRALVVLRDLEGLSYEEVAHALEMPMGSVKGRLHRARGELIELLRANSYEWGLPE